MSYQRNMRAIVQSEIERRQPLYTEALNILQPIIDIIREACAEGAKASISIWPPTDRSANVVSGRMLCRSFHQGVGRRIRRYSIEVSAGPICKLTLDPPKRAESQDEYYYKNDDRYYDETPDPNVFWTETYNSQELINIAFPLIEEALITDAVERQGDMNRIRVSKANY